MSFRISRVVPAFCASLMVVQATRAESISVGPLTLEVPAGWTLEKKSAALVQLTSPQKDDDRASVLVSVQAAPAEKFDATFNAFATSATQKKYDPKLALDGRTAGGFKARSASARFRTENRQGDTVRLTATIAAVQGQKHFVGLVLVTRGTVGEYVHDDAFQALVRSIKLDDAPALPQPPATRQELSGLHVAFGLTNQINGFGGMDLVQTRDVLYFLPGGAVLTEIPPVEQINKPDINAVRKTQPTRVGSYQFDGGTLVVSTADEYGFIEDKTGPYKAQGKGFEFDGMTYLNIPPAKDSKLNGEFTASSATSGPGAAGGVSGGVASSKTFVFKPDGSYSRTGQTSVAVSVESGDARTGVAGNNPKKSEAGTYAFDGYVLTLIPAGGKAVKLTAYRPEDGLLIIDDDAYLRPDEKGK